MGIRFTAAEVADSYERGFAHGYETAVVRAAASLYSAAQEYGTQGRDDDKAIALALWVYVLSLHESPNDG